MLAAPRAILKKSGKAHISELKYDLTGRGLLWRHEGMEEFAVFRSDLISFLS
jgi:hypothetical protein